MKTRRPYLSITHQAPSFDISFEYLLFISSQKPLTNQKQMKMVPLFPSAISYRYYTNLGIWKWCAYSWVWFSNPYLEKKPHAFKMLWLKKNAADVPFSTSYLIWFKVSVQKWNTLYGISSGFLPFHDSPQLHSYKIMNLLTQKRCERKNFVKIWPQCTKLSYLPKRFPQISEANTKALCMTWLCWSNFFIDEYIPTHWHKSNWNKNKTLQTNQTLSSKRWKNQSL